ncbi:MAG: methyltransferase domain-containing protein [Deltaproteobacteria bacterium]|nr:MAG: methyltransferase domain-containing protein [Deltaproteobacteria bacterium]
MGSGQGWNIGQLLSTSSAYWRSSTVHAAVKLEIFTALNDAQLTVAEVNARIGANERGIAMLLNALTAMGLLEHNDSRYKNTDFSRSCLVKDEPGYIGYIIMHHFHLVDAWAKLHEAVTLGEPVEKLSHGEEAERESFQMGMFNLAMAIAPTIAASVNLDGKRHLLDLGGGPGTHAIHFCLANPMLRATIYDRKTTEPFAQKTTERFGVADRIDFVAGDFNADPIEGTFDVAWLSQILHSNSEEECQALIEKTIQALEPGGYILIHDFFLNDSLDGPLFPALFSMNMLLNNQGRSYSEKEVSDMLRQAGASDIHRLQFQGPNDSAILCGTARRE